MIRYGHALSYNNIENSQAGSRIYSFFDSPNTISFFLFSLSYLELQMKFSFIIIGSSASNFIFAPYSILVFYAIICVETDTQ